MTGTEFRTLHGDPATWTDHDFTVYQDLAVAAEISTPGAAHFLSGGVTRAGKSKPAESLTSLKPAA
ncbi:hypothetical protein OHA04_45645 (plasmid) [Streptomyces sp. NBC_01590]|uniref:hypothetical protein n=1 Tax=Streptomyces sp. NBC_01590 TaxID=2975887 RepID=UPI002F91AAD5